MSLVLFFLVLPVACSKKEEASQVETETTQADSSNRQKADVTRPFDVERITNGARLFQEKCAQCHGPEAQGHPDWQRGRKEGFPAAPPLNGMGTAVGLSRTQMIDIIRRGASLKGQPVMPAWGGRVSERDIADIIAWYQALWPAEVYQKWQRAYASGGSSPVTGKDKG